MTDPNKPDQNISDDDWAAAMSKQGDDAKPVEDEWAAAMAEQEDDAKPVEEDEWAAAMAEQEDDAKPVEEDDPWAEALAEQQAVEAADQEPEVSVEPAAEARSASDSVFRPLEPLQGKSEARDLEMIMDIPVKLTVELGRTRLTIKQLLELAQGSVIELDGLAGEPMDILINGYLIAQGEVVVVEDKYGIRITEIVTPSERVQKLNR